MLSNGSTQSEQVQSWTELPTATGPQFILGFIIRKTSFSVSDSYEETSSPNRKNNSQTIVGFLTIIFKQSVRVKKNLKRRGKIQFNTRKGLVQYIKPKDDVTQLQNVLKVIT